MSIQSSGLPASGVIGRTGAAATGDPMQRISMAVQRGDVAGARAIAEEARKARPKDARLANTAGDLALKAGDPAAAASHFADACKLAPDTLDFALNHAIALQQQGLDRQVIARLEPRAAAGAKVARYASIRALSHRTLGEPAEAARWYDQVLALDPNHIRGHHGRARVALERGEAGALVRFDTAIKLNPGDADLWLGKAQALDVEGDIAGARIVADQICAQAPGFIAALEFASGLRLAAGESDYTAPFKDAAKRAPQDPNIAFAHARTLSGLDHFAQAADVSAEARTRFAGQDVFALLEATNASCAGQWERAEAIFAGLNADTPDAALHEARHRLRARDADRAQALLGRALAGDASDISAWALQGIAWRIAPDAHSKDRAAWLHEQAGLVQFRPLEGRSGLIDDCVALLREIHAGSAMPLGQSLRGGTQTRGILFHRTEPLLAELHTAICDTIKAYRADLPAHDGSHPLLRHCGKDWRLAGSWSVRLTAHGNPDNAGDGDYHASHIHPQGITSSALYLVVPDAAHAGGQHGWLEIGRPPPDLGLSLEPLRVIQPQIGHLALFPSTLYHGTTAFGGGASGADAERMTVAFDVVPQAG
ncbi:MAG: putative 2OG-Fe(II) oxygenase [Pseudomonadota bacterium]